MTYVYAILWILTVAAAFAYGARVGKNRILAKRDELVADFEKYLNDTGDKLEDKRDEVRAKLRAELKEAFDKLNDLLGG